MISISKWYHTGDEEWDTFVDRNIDLFWDALVIYGAHTFRKQYQQALGMGLSHTILYAYAARFGADVVGYYLTGVLDPDEGRANWNRFQDRIYDWGGLEDYQLLGIGIDDFLPNPIALAEVVAESLLNMHDYVNPLWEHSINIGFSHLTSWTRPNTLNIRDFVRTNVPDHSWNAEPGWRHR